MIKIESGLLKGLKIQVCAEIRPTQAKLRQAVGNILQTSLFNARVLDLCAGSGGVGLELISRGAKSLYGIEKNPVVFKQLKINYAAAFGRLNENGEMMAILSDIFVFLKKNTAKFDIVWLDPPYADFESYLSQLEIIFESVVDVGGVLLCEVSRQSLVKYLSVKENFQTLVSKERKFGDTVLITLEKRITL